MATFGKWGFLEKLGITEEQFMTVIVRGEINQMTDPPTYGTVIELYYFASEVAGSLRQRPNRVLKCLMDLLFPQFSVSRADRLERRVRRLCNCLERMTEEELAEYLQRLWIPQPTGMFIKIL